MNTLITAWTVVLVILLIRSLLDLFFICSNIDWLKKNAKISPKSQATRFVICIPALCEQDIITSTLAEMLALDYPKNQVDIYVVTTAKEKKRDNLPTTNAVVKSYRNKLKLEDKKRLHVLNYPHADGRMAHQINFVASHAADNLQRDNCYFVIYNADSNIQPDALNIVDGTISKLHRQSGNYPRILQQSAVYSYTPTSSWLESSVAMGAAMHQSRWTLTHELTRLRRQSQDVVKLNGNSLINSIIHTKIAHCVGHGLFVHGKYYANNPLPTNILNEDLPYGLMQCAVRNPIHPLPTLELASSPARLANVYRQKTVWFNPFFEFHTCIRQLIATGRYKSTLEIYLLGIQAYITMFIWLFHSTFWIAGLVLSILLGWQYIVVWIIAFTIYWAVPSVIYNNYINGQKIYSCFSMSSLLLGSVYVLSHSIGPIICVARWMKASMMGTKPTKPKTVST